MSSSCLFGPSFSLNAETYFSDNNVEVAVVFEQPEDESLIIAYEWYLDNCLVIDNNNLLFASSLSCGSHQIAVRVLTSEGWSGIVSHEFSTCRLPVSIVISGPEMVPEGDQATYKVFRTFTDGYAEELTSKYTFQSSAGGTFSGNIFTAINDDQDFQNKAVTISALEDGEVKAVRVITVVNVTQVTLAFIKITGPSSLNEGASGTYTVIGTYSDGSIADISSQYSFSASEGFFNGQVYTAVVNTISGDSRQVSINASKDGLVKATLQINVIDNSIGVGILVVDFYNNTGLNIIAFLENADIQHNHNPAFTGNNIVPGAALPASALILASDLNPSNTNWRFEFNLAKLIAENPLVSDFAFSINGRGTSAGQLMGAYSLRSSDAVMVMNGNTGNYMPSVSGGSNIGGLTNFDRPISAGANGSYLESDLPVIIRFNYNVPSKSLSYSSPVTINYNLQRNPPPPSVDANFSLQKNGVSTDLVTFVGTGTSNGSYNIGDTLTVNTFHYLSTRWPDDATLSLDIKDNSGNVVHHFQGGILDVADVHSHSFVLTDNLYLIEVSSHSTDTSLSTPGYKMFNDRLDIGDGAVLISITDSTTGYVMLDHFPMPAYNSPRNGAYNVVNDNGSQLVAIENTSNQQISITLKSDHGFQETFDLAAANGVVKTVTDKSGIEVYINQLPI